VRIVDCDDIESAEAMALVGMEAVVNELDILNGEDLPGHVGITVLGDDDWCFLPHELEPITDSYEKTEWSACVWQPEHLQVPA
jgi:hypothetical protein